MIDGKWETVAPIAEVPKNKSDKVVISKVRFVDPSNKSTEYIKSEVWKKNKDGTEYPVKGQSITVRPEVAQAWGKVLCGS